MLRRKQEVFTATDGVLYVCADGDGRAARGADFSDASLLETVFPLNYRRMRISSRDVELMDATGTELTIKAEVRRVLSLTPDLECTSMGRVYELTRVEDRGRTSWLWLAEVATDGQATLVGETVTLDSHGIPTVKTTETTVWCRKAARSTERSTSDGSERLRPALTLRVRSSDYAGESTLVRDGVTYTVTKTASAGKWLDIDAERKLAD